MASDTLAWRPCRTFGVWHDRAVFHFLRDPDAQARYLAHLDTALHNDGMAVFGTFAEDGPTGLADNVAADPQVLSHVGEALPIDADTWRGARTFLAPTIPKHSVPRAT